MQTLGWWIALLSGLAITIIGVLYLLRPRMIAATFGLPVLPSADATAWLRIKGIRDLTAGVTAGVLLSIAPPFVLGWVLLAFALIPLGDATTVIVARGKAAAAWGIHGATALVMIAGGCMLLIGQR